MSAVTPSHDGHGRGMPVMTACGLWHRSMVCGILNCCSACMYRSWERLICIEFRSICIKWQFFFFCSAEEEDKKRREKKIRPFLYWSDWGGIEHYMQFNNQYTWECEWHQREQNKQLSWSVLMTICIHVECHTCSWNNVIHILNHSSTC